MFPYTSRLAYGGGMTDNMLDDNVLGSVDNQENVEAHHDREHDPRRRRRRDTVLHQPQPNINQVSCVPASDSWSLPMLPISATCVFDQAVGNFGRILPQCVCTEISHNFNWDNGGMSLHWPLCSLRIWDIKLRGAGGVAEPQ